MKLRNFMLTLALITLGAIASGEALADHGHFHSRARVGVVIGAPAIWPWYYPPPYYYYPPTVVVPSSPPVYVEQGEGPAPAPQSSYWYYCADAQAYYPYVKQCPGGWQRVAPEPPPNS